MAASPPATPAVVPVAPRAPVGAARAPPAEGTVKGTVEGGCQEKLPRLEQVKADLQRYSGAHAGKTGKPRTGHFALRERFPPPPGATPLVDIGDELIANGVPMTLGSFETTLEAPAVLEFYAHHFEDKGYPWSGPRETLKHAPFPAVSATDPEEDLQLTVMAIAHDEGAGTTVIVGISDMVATPPAPELDGLGSYPNAAATTTSATDPDTRSVTLTFATDDAIETVEAFVQEKLGARGYTQTRPPQISADTRSLRYDSALEQWVILLARAEGRTLVTAVNTRGRAVAQVAP